jgi:hypothetical protein
MKRFLLNSHKLRISSTDVKRHLVFLSILAMVVMIAYPAWFLPEALGFDDLTRLNAPQRMLLPWFYLHGHLPLWNPFSFGGQPFLAAGQSGPLYLPNILFLMLPIVSALKWSYIFHQLLAAFGTYAVVWRLGRTRLGALVGGLAFVTSGFMIGHQIHTQMFDAMSWLPLIFWFALKALDHFSWPNIAGLSACVAVEIYAGHPQVTFYILLTVSLYTLLTLLQVRTRRQLNRSFGVLSGILLGLALSAPQWLLTLDLVSYSNRDNVTPAFLLKGSLPVSGFLQFLTPFTAGGGYSGQSFSLRQFFDLYQTPLFWEFTSYVGLIVLILAMSMIISGFRKQIAVRNLTIMIIFSLILALGANTILKLVLTHFPGFDLFRIPARYVGIADFSIAILGGLGIGQIRRTSRLMQWSIAAVSIALSLVLLMVFHAHRFGGIPRRALIIPLSVSLTVGLVSLFPFKRLKRTYMLGLALLAIVDSVSQSATLSTFTLTAFPAYLHPSRGIQYVQKHRNSHSPFSRVVSLDDASLSYDLGDAFRIPTLNGYDSLEPRWYARNINLTWTTQTLLNQPRSILDAMDIKYVMVPSGDLNTFPTLSLGKQSYMHWVPSMPKSATGILIRVRSGYVMPAMAGPLFSVTLVSGQKSFTQLVSGIARKSYVISIPANWPKQAVTQIVIHNESWQDNYTISNLSWFGMPSRLVRPFLTVNTTMGPKAWKRVFTDNQETIWENQDELQDAWLTPSLGSPMLKLPGQTRLVQWSPNRQLWQTTSKSGGYFVLSQLYDPNWHVTVDGHVEQVQPLGVTFGKILTGVKLPPGKHRISFTYFPHAFAIGLDVFGLASLLWLALWAIEWRRRKHASATP